MNYRIKVMKVFFNYRKTVERLR